ncbi:MAG TPA: IS30 family transposase [Gemmatimonadaceae bacterium]|nr:IS30 family transposase [Gemmatimonadaceae bacterium]
MGQSISEIGRALGKQSGSIHGVLASNGGVTPYVKSRACCALTLAEREEISRGLVEGLSVREIAALLQRAPSTVSREIARNRGRSKYRAALADDRAWIAAKRPKTCLLAKNKKLRKLVAEKLQEDWSPQQISGWLAATKRGPTMQISHETIYRSLYLKTRGVLQRELIACLRSRRTMRRGKRSSTEGQRRGQIIDAVSIRDRPSEIETRATAGHWEGDLIAGARNTHIATLVERYSRYLLLVRINGKDTASVVGALIQKVKQLPQGLLLSLTWDRGTELAMHKVFTKETGIPVYFCDPRSPWQRGTNENTNGLLRQYFPNGLALSSYSQHELDVIALRLNRRPRKTLGFLSPRARITGAVAATG